MKRSAAAIIALGLLCAAPLCMVGCAKKSTTSEETTVSTPEGKTTVTTETEVKKSGENPPDVK